MADKDKTIIKPVDEVIPKITVSVETFGKSFDPKELIVKAVKPVKQKDSEK